MGAAYTSENLFHFVGWARPTDHEANFETLGKVLESRRIAHSPFDGPSRTQTEWNGEGKLAHETLVKGTVTCYADIPTEALGVHLSKYGRFGLGFRRALLIQHGARPVLYVPTDKRDWAGMYGRSLLGDIEAAARGLRAWRDKRIAAGDRPRSRSVGAIPEDEAAVLETALNVFQKDILAFVKPFDAELAVEHPSNFYMEREWRKYGHLEFSLSDITHLWVAEGYVDRARKRWPELSDRIAHPPA